MHIQTWAREVEQPQIELCPFRYYVKHFSRFPLRVQRVTTAAGFNGDRRDGSRWSSDLLRRNCHFSKAIYCSKRSLDYGNSHVLLDMMETPATSGYNDHVPCSACIVLRQVDQYEKKIREGNPSNPILPNHFIIYSFIFVYTPLVSILFGNSFRCAGTCARLSSTYSFPLWNSKGNKLQWLARLQEFSRVSTLFDFARELSSLTNSASSLTAAILKLNKSPEYYDKPTIILIISSYFVTISINYT